MKPQGIYRRTCSRALGATGAIVESRLGRGGTGMNIEFGVRRLANSLVRATKRVLRFGGEEGGALVEFAVTLPLFVTVITGTASLSLGAYSLQQLANAT